MGNSWKLGSQNSQTQAHFWCACKFSFFPVFTTPRPAGAYLGKNVKALTPKKGPIWAKNGKNRTAEIFGTTHIDPKSKNNCTLFSSFLQQISPFSRYGRLKLIFLCEWYSHCIYSSCWINQDQKYMEPYSSAKLCEFISKVTVSESLRDKVTCRDVLRLCLGQLKQLWILCGALLQW